MPFTNNKRVIKETICKSCNDWQRYNMIYLELRFRFVYCIDYDIYYITIDVILTRECT